MYPHWAGWYGSFTKFACTLTIFITFHESDVILNDKLLYYVVLCFISRLKCIFWIYSWKCKHCFCTYFRQLGPISGRLCSYFQQREYGSENVLIFANRWEKCLLVLVLNSTEIINFMLPILVITLAVFTFSLMWVTNKVGIEEKRHYNGYRVRLRLAHKILFFSQVIRLITVKLLIFDTRNVVLCVDIRYVVFWSGFKWLLRKIKSVLFFKVSAGAHSIDLSIFIMYLFSAVFKVNNYLFLVILKF